MSSIIDEQGLINNFAKEPKMYVSEKPSQTKKRGYALQGIVAGLLVTALVYISVVVS